MSPGKDADEEAINFALAVIAGIEPQDELEAMLGMQMVAIHLATMTFTRRLAHVETLDQQHGSERALNKLARTFAMQLEALKRYRTGGEQKVVVQHVNVNEGGQAIVGTVDRGRGDMEGSDYPIPRVFCGAKTRAGGHEVNRSSREEHFLLVEKSRVHAKETSQTMETANKLVHRAEELLANVKNDLHRELEERLKRNELLVGSTLEKIETQWNDKVGELERQITNEIELFKKESDNFIKSHQQGIEQNITEFLGKQNVLVQNLSQQTAVPDIPLGPVIRGYEESAFVNFLEQSHDAAGGWPRYGEPPAVG